MTNEIPQYGLRAYSLFFTKHGLKEEFSQSDLDWIVKQSMKKKIFSLLLRSGWIKKASRDKYVCVSPENAIKGLLEFKVPNIIKNAERQYAFTDLSAIEIWSDYSYVQRGIEKSPYFIKVLKKDLSYWKMFFNKYEIPVYISGGGTIGEYIILRPVANLRFTEKDGYNVINLSETINLAKANDVYSYSYKYMRRVYGSTTN
jgi:hypothetical protein